MTDRLYTPIAVKQLMEIVPLSVLRPQLARVWERVWMGVMDITAVTLDADGNAICTLLLSDVTTVTVPADTPCLLLAGSVLETIRARHARALELLHEAYEQRRYAEDADYAKACALTATRTERAESSSDRAWRAGFGALSNGDDA